MFRAINNNNSKNRRNQRDERVQSKIQVSHPLGLSEIVLTPSRFYTETVAQTTIPAMTDRLPCQEEKNNSYESSLFTYAIPRPSRHLKSVIRVVLPFFSGLTPELQRCSYRTLSLTHNCSVFLQSQSAEGKN